MGAGHLDDRFVLAVNAVQAIESRASPAQDRRTASGQQGCRIGGRFPGGNAAARETYALSQ